MEKKDTDSYHNNNSVNSYGTNYGNIGHSVNVNYSKPPGLNASLGEEMDVWKNAVFQLVTASRMEEALGEILKAQPSEDVRKQVALLGGRFSQLKIEKIAGSVDKDMETTELNRIRDGILTLLSMI